jgi:hypothetical protein
MWMLFKIVAPSLVTTILSWPGPGPTDFKILSYSLEFVYYFESTIPLGPRVVFIRSAIAIAPMKDD